MESIALDLAALEDIRRSALTATALDRMTPPTWDEWAAAIATVHQADRSVLAPALAFSRDAFARAMTPAEPVTVRLRAPGVRLDVLYGTAVAYREDLAHRTYRGLAPSQSSLSPDEQAALHVHVPETV